MIEWQREFIRCGVVIHWLCVKDSLVGFIEENSDSSCRAYCGETGYDLFGHLASLKSAKRLLLASFGIHFVGNQEG